MEFNEKLQALRKQKGVTQDELAKSLFVSRTAISKWESGRGYPNIDSLKMIASYFSVTIDKLLSTDEALVLAEEKNKEAKFQFRTLVFGLIDLASIMLLFLPLFASKVDGGFQSDSLVNVSGIQLYLKVLYFVAVIGAILIGALNLALQGCKNPIWIKIKEPISLIIGVFSVLLFIVSTQIYASIFVFVLLSIKVFFLIKRY